MKTYLDGRVVVHGGDCISVLATLNGCSVDSVVCDPPYGIDFMGKDWDSFGRRREYKAREGYGDRGVLPGYGRGGTSEQRESYRRKSNLSFQGWCEAWARECLRVLKPGGHILAFSGTRTYHRMACAIEDAGFEIRDQLAWMYGSGFPKSRNLDGDWQGWGSALKPAWEPIVLARKPMAGTLAANVDQNGTGALNIDGCRVAAEPRPLVEANRRLDHNTYGAGLGGLKAVGSTDLGRWPANVIHDGSEEVVAGFPDAPGQQRAVGPEHGAKSTVNCYGDYGARDQFNPRGDSGSAARFFYTAKADAEDRIGSKHPTVKPIDLMQYLCRLVTPPGGTVLDPFAGTGTTGEAAWREGFNAILIEREPEYLEDIARRMELAVNPSKRAAVAKTKNNIDDLGPLFANTGEAAE